VATQTNGIAIVIIGIMCLEFKLLAHPIPSFETEQTFDNRYNRNRLYPQGFCIGDFYSLFLTVPPNNRLIKSIPVDKSFLFYWVLNRFQQFSIAITLLPKIKSINGQQGP